jgi:Tfp pilus assembly protein PilV
MRISMFRFRQHPSRVTRPKAGGFTIIEIVVGVVVFAIVVVGIANAYKSVQFSYTTARQMNEVYTVLSACPELDRALEFSSLSNSNNCYPNNVFQVENTSLTSTNAYAPTITVTDTTALTSSDPLKNIPDSKAIDLSVALPRPNNNAPAFKLRILITRNGIGQL